ncbi:hypothetical protein TI39_contig840g00006 [Zymoseptoria brevis]|uniref:Uncharacterized protein n=1 Tax=Zymoseptoria brevis TaxID=1047168 RepID=A0A0F4GFG9_9PEZI|nr:hypothetical protein TI39_contig840g00006 [Zymoseptoria brevis]
MADRKYSRPHQRSYSMIDMGDISPLYPSGTYQTESSMRSTLERQLPNIQPGDSGARVPRTLPDPQYKTVNPENLVKEPARIPEVLPQDDEDEAQIAQVVRAQASHAPTPSWTAINAASSPYRLLHTDADTFAQSAGYSISDVQFRMNEILTLSEDEVDTSKDLPGEEDDNGVYHINHKRRPTGKARDDGASYSVVLERDDPTNIPPQAVIFLQRKLAKEVQAERELKVPALEHRLRFVLAAGAKLMVERVGDVAAPKGALQCILPRKFQPPRCTFGSKPMGPGRYFLSLRRGLVDWRDDRHFLFCLDCFEKMWNCNYTTGNWPPKTIELFSQSDQGEGPDKGRADSLLHGYPHYLPSITYSPGGTATVNPPVLVNSAAGRIDSLTSPPANAPITSSTPSTPPLKTPSPTPQAFNAESSSSTPDSVDSKGDWTWPPVRLQHISEFFMSKRRNKVPEAEGKQKTQDDSLDFGLHDKDAAKVRLWKAVSREQRGWVRHMERTRLRRKGIDIVVKKPAKMVGEEDDDEGLLEDDEEDDDVYMEELEKDAGLKRWQCYGNTLGDVLRL